MIVRGFSDLQANYHRLRAGDIYLGRIHTAFLRQTLFVDLLQRGVHCLPSPLSQLLNGSKAAQAMVLKDWMLPLTRVIRRRHDLIDAAGEYAAAKIGPVVTKADRMHCGHGVRRWNDVETLYNTEAYSADAYPMVLQPFVEKPVDVRVIIAGSYVEAYRRFTPNGFRMNMAAGATSTPFDLSDAAEDFCRRAMARGGFPYAHLDLLIGDDGRRHLSELALHGGVKGARIERDELERIQTQVLEQLAEEIEATAGRPAAP
jgi:ribosomal protein S6--L-glutamate ligase